MINRRESKFWLRLLTFKCNTEKCFSLSLFKLVVADLNYQFSFHLVCWYYLKGQCQSQKGRNLVCFFETHLKKVVLNLQLKIWTKKCQKAYYTGVLHSLQIILLYWRYEILTCFLLASTFSHFPLRILLWLSGKTFKYRNFSTLKFLKVLSHLYKTKTELALPLLIAHFFSTRSALSILALLVSISKFSSNKS